MTHNVIAPGGGGGRPVGAGLCAVAVLEVLVAVLAGIVVGFDYAASRDSFTLTNSVMDRLVGIAVVASGHHVLVSRRVDGTPRGHSSAIPRRPKRCGRLPRGGSGGRVAG